MENTDVNIFFNNSSFILKTPNTNGGLFKNTRPKNKRNCVSYK